MGTRSRGLRRRVRARPPTPLPPDGRPGPRRHAGGRARPGLVEIEKVSRTRVEPRRWTSIRVVLPNRLAAVPEVLLTGHGEGVRVGRLLVDGMLHEERRAVWGRVRLQDDRARRVELVTRPSGVAFPRTDTRTVVLRPRR